MKGPALHKPERQEALDELEAMFMAATAKMDSNQLERLEKETANRQSLTAFGFQKQQHGSGGIR